MHGSAVASYRSPMNIYFKSTGSRFCTKTYQKSWKLMFSQHDVTECVYCSHVIRIEYKKYIWRSSWFPAYIHLNCTNFWNKWPWGVGVTIIMKYILYKQTHLYKQTINNWTAEYTRQKRICGFWIVTVLS